jgi:hypothetical protein
MCASIDAEARDHPISKKKWAIKICYFINIWLTFYSHKMLRSTYRASSCTRLSPLLFPPTSHKYIILILIASWLELIVLALKRSSHTPRHHGDRRLATCLTPSQGGWAAGFALALAVMGIEQAEHEVDEWIDCLGKLHTYYGCTECIWGL